MTKIKISSLLLFGFPLLLQAQNYGVQYSVADSSVTAGTLNLTAQFQNKEAAVQYIYGLPQLLQSKGYAAAAIDSVRLDSAAAWVQLYAGPLYKWLQLHTSAADERLLASAGINSTTWQHRPFLFEDWYRTQQNILNYLEEHGHPFGKVYLDSVSLQRENISGRLRIEAGPEYKIDSIRVYGTAKVANSFLQQYLGLPAGGPYNKKKLAAVSNRLAQLPYLQEEKPAELTLLATGSVLNLYLAPKKNSLFNVLVGFLPNPDVTAAKRFQVTGDANILLRNALGSGETIGLNWQQLQRQSPRLSLLFEQPYLSRTPVGLQASFEMFRKDSSFLNIAMRLGATYQVNATQSAAIFYQRRSSIVNGINAAQIIFSKQLPPDADVASHNLGISYNINTTDYRTNPRRGWEFSATGSGGTKRIKKNNAVLELKDPSNPSFSFASLYDTVKLSTYQLRATVAAARYLPLRRLSVLKLAVQGGAFQSGNVFRNELFQIGGYRLLRGFDEESQYLQYYSVGTAEYRYLIGQNAFFFAFADGGWGRQTSVDYKYLSAGLGMSLETKAGIINLAWALGKRNDTDANLRGSKIHLGFLNYF